MGAYVTLNITESTIRRALMAHIMYGASRDDLREMANMMLRRRLRAYTCEVISDGCEVNDDEEMKEVISG